MIENYRSGLLLETVLASHRTCKQGLRKLGFTFAEESILQKIEEEQQKYVWRQ